MTIYFNNLYSQTPTWYWASNGGGFDKDEAKAVTTDKSGNVLVTGYFRSSNITFGLTTLNQNGNDDIFLVKYNSKGNVLWAKSAGGKNDDEAYAIATDNQGYTYVAGAFKSSSLSFGTWNLNTKGSYDMFIAKYDQNGNVIWAKSFGGPGDEQINTITTDSLNNIYIGGTFNSSSLTIGATTFNNKGGNDIILIKLDYKGNILNSKAFGGNNDDNLNNIKVSADNKIFLTGNFKSDTLFFDNISLLNHGNNDAFITKLNDKLSSIWAKSFGGIADEYSNALNIDKDGNLVITGSFVSSSLVIGNDMLNKQGSYDIFVSKIDSSGKFIWSKSAGGEGTDIATGITSDINNNIYISGYYTSSIIYFDSISKVNSGSLSSDGLIAKFDSKGKVIWMKTLGGTSNDYAYDISVNNTGDKMYITGSFSSNDIYFGNINLINNGNLDTYIAKLGDDISTKYNFTPIICNGSRTSVTVTVSGGTPPYTYSWSNGMTTKNLNNIPAGNYYVIINDTNGLSVQLDINITQPKAITTNAIIKNGCFNGNNGSVTLNPANGTQPYNYSWSTGSNSNFIDNLSPGNYSVTVSDLNNCNVTNNFKIINPPILKDTFTIYNASCNGLKDGRIILNVTGGTIYYKYFWSNGSSNYIASKLGPGLYKVTVKDANGCIITDSMVVTEPAGINITHVTKNASCNGNSDGQIQLTVTGNSPSTIFKWSNGNNTKDLLGIKAGTYSVTVTDSIYCSIHTAQVKEPSLLNLNLISSSDTNSTCHGKIIANCTGGTLPYKFLWNDPKKQISSIASGLCTGKYTIVVTDKNNCTISDSANVINYISNFISVQQYKIHNNLSLYPNPAEGESITITGIDNNKKFNLYIFDELSRVIYSEMNQKTDSNSKCLNLKNIKAGIYFIKLEYTDLMYPLIKFIKN
ncbi:MAG: T9SS type A sorting domain-containing protein [Bacteroidota bacterium]|nr:T9SS type A sorting domain-containing protein [Bacteroidota bacterium]